MPARQDPMGELLHELMNAPSRSRTCPAQEVCANEHGRLIFSSSYIFVPHDIGTFLGSSGGTELAGAAGRNVAGRSA